jgi:CHASE2 domain-containing sensor protein
VDQTKLVWQSKLVLLVVLPFTAADLVLKTHWWTTQSAPVALWTVGLSALLGLATWKLRAATAGGSAAGAAITASLVFSTLMFPYQPWHTALIPAIAVSMLAYLVTRMEEARHGRTAKWPFRRPDNGQSGCGGHCLQ